jgi:tetratricopeptide (TPR) repeat protein
MLTVIAACMAHVASPADAAAEPAAQRFAEGQRAVEAGALPEALHAFEAAIAAGLEGPAVHYNVGVVAYRLDLLDRAADAFAVVARTPEMTALAWYNLGLVELKRGNQAAARRWFERSREATDDERLAGLVDARLAELTGTRAPSRWSVFAMLGGGYDENVRLLGDDVSLPASGLDDAFVEAQFALSGPLDGRWRFDLGAAAVNYADVDEYDQTGASAAVHRKWGGARWHAEAGVQGNYYTLDGEGYERSAAVVLQASNTLRSGTWLRLRYRGSGIDGLHDFEGLTGSRHEASAAIERRRGAVSLGAEYRFEDNNADDPLFAYSWHQLGALLQWAPVDGRWATALDIAQRRTDHDDRGGLGPSSEDRMTVTVTGAVRLGIYLRLVARYEWQDNSAEVDAYDYDRQRISLGFDFAR